MIFKRIVTLLLIASLGACAGKYSLPSKDTSNLGGANTFDKSLANEEVIAKGPVESELGTLSPNELLVQPLIHQTDLYQNTKRALSSSAKAKVVNALTEFNADEFEKSEKSMNNILVTELNLSSAVYVLAGDIALANNKSTEAVTHYEAALVLNEYNAKAANRLAMQKRELGEFLLAEKLYSQAIKAQPREAESYRNRAVLYDLYLDEKASAMHDYQVYSGLLQHSLTIHQQQRKAELSQASTLLTQNTALEDSQLKAIKSNIKLVNRWLADVGRQVATLVKVENNNAGGN